MITLRINGKDFTYDGDPSVPLLWVLRDEAGLTGTKFGCGEALCGACTVHVDGQATRSCGMVVSDAVGHEIVTIEGLHPTRRPSGAEGLARIERAAMRLLPGRTDHAGRRAAEADAASVG